MRSYGDLQLTVSSPAQTFTEKVTLLQAKEYLRLDPSNTTQDDTIGGLISGARVIGEILRGVDLIPKQYDLYLDQFSWPEIELRYPLQSVELVQSIDSDGTVTALAQATDYDVDTARAIVRPIYAGSWPSTTLRPSSAVLFRFTSGYSASHPFWSNHGQMVIQGMRLLISDWFYNRLPYTQDVREIPYGITALLSFGARPRVY